MFQGLDGEVGRRGPHAARLRRKDCPALTTFRDQLTHNAFKRSGAGEVAPVMDSPEDDALNAVDRISRAVDYLRDLLVAATEAELRANGRQLRAQEGPEG